MVSAFGLNGMAALSDRLLERALISRPVAKLLQVRDYRVESTQLVHFNASFYYQKCVHFIR